MYKRIRHFDFETFGYSFPRFSSLLKKREEEKEDEVANTVIISHACLLDPELHRLIVLFELAHFWWKKGADLII